MKKLLFFSLVFCGLCNICPAEESNIHAQTNIIKSEVHNRNIQVIHFSSALLNASKECIPYSENLVNTNHDWKQYKKIFGLKNGSVIVDIKGKNNDGKCVFSVKNSLLGTDTITHTCALSKEQMDELISTMSVKDPTPYTETFITNQIIENEDGSTQKIPTELTITDSKFNILWSKLRLNVCEEKKDEGASRIKEKIFSFSPEFMEKLKECQPVEETKNILFASFTVSVKGYSGNKCHISFPPFELFADRKDLPQTDTIEKLYEFIETRPEENVVYVPEYPSDGITQALNACKQGIERYEGMKSSETFGTVVIRKGMMASWKDNVCRIKMVNRLERGNVKKQYQKICNIPRKELSLFVKDKKTEQNAEFDFSFNTAEDKKIQQQLLNGDWCE